MNSSDNTTNASSGVPSNPIYCPSCAARVNGFSGQKLQCPVCGTEFIANSVESAEQTIATSDTGPRRRPSTEEILLERLKHEPPQRESASPIVLLILVAAIGLVTYLIYRTSAKPDQYAAPRGIDSSQLFKQRLQTQPLIDSFETVLRNDPNNANAHLALANGYYDGQYWAKSIAQFQMYLQSNPQDVGARVDYAYAMAQQPDGIPPALEEIDSALKIRPDYLPGLYNGGILAVQLTKGVTHAEALSRARSYFERAKSVADTAAPLMAKQIDTLLIEIDKTGNIPVKN